MKIYCMSDIHACLESFEAALENVICHLDEDDTMLLLLGDYVHGGDYGRGVLDKIMHLQEQYGNDKVMALMGNHEDMVISGESTIDSMYGGMQWYDNENADDLFQIGCIGLIKAIDNFDSTLGVKFSTYAVPMIIGEIRRFLRDNNSIRVSRSLKDTAYKAIYARDTLTRKNLKEPTMEEIAAEVGISKEDIVYALDAMQNPMSLYEPVYTDGGDTLYVMDQISDKKNKEETWVEHLSLSEAMKRLNDRERHIISLRFFEGKTQTEVADMIGISQAQVSRLEKNALKAMRGYLTA